MSTEQNRTMLRHPWQLVAHREISTKLRDRTFIGSTVFMLVLVLAALIIPALLSGRDDPDKIAVIDEPGASIVQRADATNGGDAFELTRSRTRPRRNGSSPTATCPPRWSPATAVRRDRRRPAGLEDRGEPARGRREHGDGAERGPRGVDPGTVADHTQLQERLLDPDPLPDAVSDFVNLALALVFYMTALGFGMMIAQSVVQEKESRVVEILAAAVPVRALLWGKVIGNTVLALGQIVVIAAGTLVGLLVTGQADVLEVVAPVAGWFLVFFVLGFVALAGLWAVAGSLATRQEDLGSTTLPGQMILMIPFFFSLFAGDQAKEVASFVPIASSMAMPGRMLSDDVPIWQPLLAILFLLVATVLIVRVAARLYERTLLQTGRRMGYREAIKAKAD
jgi:ABC-2 type transport system permease protein